ncbi:hypothetical protein FLA_2760 [Filimonas lacunae]|nr:hypothetical protein FLA_2760 [Filimonas lacunae]
MLFPASRQIDNNESILIIIPPGSQSSFVLSLNVFIINNTI